VKPRAVAVVLPEAHETQVSVPALLVPYVALQVGQTLAALDEQEAQPVAQATQRLLEI